MNETEAKYLNVTEAKELIRVRVKSELNKYVAGCVAVLGLGSAGAFFGLWNVASETARDVATARAVDVARNPAFTQFINEQLVEQGKTVNKYARELEGQEKDLGEVRKSIARTRECYEELRILADKLKPDEQKRLAALLVDLSESPALQEHVERMKRLSEGLGGSPCIVAGRVSEKGVAQGTGFTARRRVEGEYVITFSNPFSAPPIFVATAVATKRYAGKPGGGQQADTTINVSSNAGEVIVWTYDINKIDKDGGVKAKSDDVGFEFIAFGQR